MRYSGENTSIFWRTIMFRSQQCNGHFTTRNNILLHALTQAKKSCGMKFLVRLWRFVCVFKDTLRHTPPVGWKKAVYIRRVGLGCSSNAEINFDWIPSYYLGYNRITSSGWVFSVEGLERCAKSPKPIRSLLNPRTRKSVRHSLVQHPMRVQLKCISPEYLFNVVF